MTLPCGHLVGPSSGANPTDITKAEITIIVDYRPGLVRISPQFYNTVEENQLVVDAIAEIVNA